MNKYKILVRKLKGKRLFGRHRCRCEDDIKRDLKTIVCEGVDWIHLTHGRVLWQALLSIVMNLWVP